MTTWDRMGRAEDYVLGLMDATERARAERDMALDSEFRGCVLDLAHKLQRLHDMKRPAQSSDEAWKEIAERIAALPQMAGLAQDNPAQVVPNPRIAQPPIAKPPIVRSRIEARRPVDRRSPLVVALGMAAVFAIFYLVGYLR